MLRSKKDPVYACLRHPRFCLHKALVVALESFSSSQFSAYTWLNMYWLIIASIASVATAAGRRNDLSCPLTFDGRVPQSATGNTFDSGKLIYDPAYVLGANLTWKDVLRFPNGPHALFDNSTAKAVEVTINDRSIFTPSADNRQTGFRRAELLPKPANVTDSVTGIKTLHWSMKTDQTRPLNYSHEYQLVWLENQDYSANQFTIGTGTPYGKNATTDEDTRTLFLLGTSATSPQQTLWKTSFTPGVWHNFGLVLDYTSNQVEIFYSKGSAPLARKTKLLVNDLSNLGQYHFGVLKKPTGPPGIDITKQGFQEPGIHEGITYGGIFEENSVGGCISVARGVKGKILR
jgi:hypothetical protein